MRRFGILLAWLCAMVLYAIAAAWERHTGGPGIILVRGVSDIIVFGILTGIECAILWALLRPGSFERSWLRALVAMVLCYPWTLAMATRPKSNCHRSRPSVPMPAALTRNC